MNKIKENLSTNDSSSWRESAAIPSTSKGEEENETKNSFHVDTKLIPQASLDEQNELSGLGLNVFNQDVFEEGVMSQVDQAIATEEQIRLHKILVKELNTINDDIKLAEKDLSRVETAVTNIEDLDSASKQTQRELDALRRQQANKTRQLKTLTVRRNNVLKKIAEFESGCASQGQSNGDGSTFDQAFQVQGRSTESAETDEQRMLRMGEMTPFGTVLKKQNPPSTKPVGLTVFEKTLAAREAPGVKVKKDFNKYLKRKALEAKLPRARVETDESCAQELKPDRTHGVSDRNREDRQSRIKSSHSLDDTLEDTNFNELPDEDDEMYCWEEEEDEYVPHKDDMQEDSSEDGHSFSDHSGDEGIMKHPIKTKRGSKPKIKRKHPRPLPVYRENDEEEMPVRSKVKRDFSIRREKDDADPEAYQERLLKHQKQEAKKAKKKTLVGAEGNEEKEDEDDQAEFEGGLQVPQELWGKLYHYQRTGVRWLWELHLQQAGGIVGDEMGLGKTIQTISFLAALRTSKVRNVNFPYRGLGPSIIVCPTTVMHQWVKEFHKWWPDFRVAVLHSSGTFNGSESEMVRSIAKSHGILVTSYNTLVIHQELVLRFNWHYVILDEGHKIRNPDAKVTLCCKQFRTPHRIILSGSPIQNNLKELWSLFDFVFPGKLGTLPDFMQHFSVPIVQGGYSNATQIQVETAYRCACVLRDTINPYLIRRMKADVKTSINLPGKNEQVLFCRITDDQRDVYEEYLSSRECNAILQGKFKVFAGLITLRKICNHPDLSTGGPQLFKGDSPGSDPELEYGFWRRSGKMIVVEALLHLWKKQNRRVLLFSQSRSMLTILEKFVQEQGYTFLSMDGGTSVGSRQPLIAQYNNDPSIYLFLLTTRVGGLGVNLTGADRVIIFDPDWNPSTDMQARERAWRIGQRKEVTIYRLLTSGTIEEKIYHRQIFKQFLTNRILKDPKQRRLFQSQHLYDLFTLGSKDNKEGTETSALFAGTGCDVRVPPKQRKHNRFDELNDRKEEEKNREKDERDLYGEEENNVEEEEESSHGVDNSEVDRMKELAKRLSRKMEEEKKKKMNVKSVENEMVPSRSLGLYGVSEDPALNRSTGNACQESPLGEHSWNAAERKAGSSGTSSGPTKEHEERRKEKHKKWKIPLKKGHTDSPPHEEEIAPRREKKRKSSDEPSEGREKSSHKKKRKHKDARFEGEKIPHLVKQRDLKRAADNQDPDHKQQKQEDHKQQDDYVLRELFKKTGIEGAMKHDKIVDSSRPDYAIVEAEAERVAREAASALKRSRRQCLSALSGAPTWTGQHGSLAAAAAKPRFGQKKNSLLVNKTDKSVDSAASSSSTTEENGKTSPGKKATKDNETLFDGSMSGSSSLNSKDNSLTSNDLLSKIRSRKRISSAPIQEEEEDEFLRPDVAQTLDPKDEELLSDIRNYVAFMASSDGRASTQEIVLNFGTRLPKADAPKFKAMLKQICDHNCGMWRLKPEFR